MSGGPGPAGRGGRGVALLEVLKPKNRRLEDETKGASGAASPTPPTGRPEGGIVNKMCPRLKIKVPDECSLQKILDIRCKKMTSPKTNKRKSSKKQKSEKTSEVPMKVSKYLVAKKFPSIGPPKNDDMPRNLVKPKGSKKLPKINHPKPLNCRTPVNSNLRKMDSKIQNNSEERKTLEMIIPPLENFRGVNNPFSLGFQSKATRSNNAEMDNDSKDTFGKMGQVKGKLITENGTMKYITEYPTLVCTSSNNVNSFTFTNQTFIETHNHLENSQEIPVEDCTREMLEKEFLCDQCPALLDTFDSLEKHVKSHTEVEQFLCNYCPTFLSFNHLEKHMKSHTEAMLVKQVLCDQCPTFWYSNENLTIHWNKSHVPKSVIFTHSLEEFENKEWYVPSIKTSKIKTFEKSLKHCGTGNKLSSMLPTKIDYYKKRKRITYTRTSQYYKNHKENISTRNSGYSNKSKTSICEETSEYYRKHGCQEISEYYRKHGQTINRGSENKNMEILPKDSESYKKQKVKILKRTSECKKNNAISKRRSEQMKGRTKGQQRNINDAEDDPMKSNDEPLVIQIDDNDEDPLLLNSEPELIVIDD